MIERLGSEAARASQREGAFGRLVQVERVLLITIWDFTGRKDSSGNQRESATLFPQDLSLYIVTTRRIVSPLSGVTT